MKILRETCLSHDINKIILLLQKNFYPNKYMDDWLKFNAALLPGREDFNSHLNIEDITDAEYAHAKVFCKDIAIKK